MVGHYSSPSGTAANAAQSGRNRSPTDPPATKSSMLRLACVSRPFYHLLRLVLEGRTPHDGIPHIGGRLCTLVSPGKLARILTSSAPRMVRAVHQCNVKPRNISTHQSFADSRSTSSASAGERRCAVEPRSPYRLTFRTTPSRSSDGLRTLPRYWPCQTDSEQDAHLRQPGVELAKASFSTLPLLGTAGDPYP